jgi:hypothetical protein
VDLFAWISADDARQLVITLGTIGGALVATAAALRLPVISRPIRWVWRRLVGEPVGHWFRALIREEVTTVLRPVMHELLPNSGSSLRDRVNVLVDDAGGPPDPKANTSELVDRDL